MMNFFKFNKLLDNTIAFHFFIRIFNVIRAP